MSLLSLIGHMVNELKRGMALYLKDILRVAAAYWTVSVEESIVVGLFGIVNSYRFVVLVFSAVVGCHVVQGPERGGLRLPPSVVNRGRTLRLV